MRTCKQMLLEFLNSNEGWWNKSDLITRRWEYDNDSSKAFSPDTLAPKLRELQRENKIQARTVGGQTEYSRLGVPNTRTITKHRIINGIAVPYQEEICVD